MRTLDNKGFDDNYIIITDELRAKYPPPPGYEWQDETKEWVACLKVGGDGLFELILRDDLVVVYVESGVKNYIETEGLEDSVRLLWTRALLGKE